MKNLTLYSSLHCLTAVLLLSAMSLSLLFGGGRVFAQTQPARENASNLNNQSESLLAKYAVNLTETSIRSDEDSTAIKGFESELKEISAALARRQPINPIIVGEDGELSASQLVQALAAKIVAGKAASSLRDKQIFWLDTANLFENTKKENELNARWAGLLAEVKAERGRVILFVRELPFLIGENSHSSTEVRQMLENAIADGSLRVIGSVLSEEMYASVFASHPTLKNAFAPIKWHQNDDNTTRKAKDEREKAGFVGAKISDDLAEMVATAGGERIRVIAQVGSVESARLTALLQNAGVEVINKIPTFGALELSVPASSVQMLADSKLVYHLAPNREIGSLGHLTKTTGFDQMLAQTGNSTLKGTGVGIAILDSGVNGSHSAFQNSSGGRVRADADFTGAGNTVDNWGHGTHVASVAAGDAMSDGDARFTGIAQDAKLLDVRVLDANGKGQTAWVLKGLDWVLSNRDAYNIRVVNMSLGANAVDSYKNDVLCRAVRKLVDHGIVVVIAAGNDGSTTGGSTNKVYGRIHSPGNEPSAITVGASNTFGTDDRADDVITTYSSRGPTRSFWKDASSVKHYDNVIKPDLVAPGNKIIAASTGSSCNLWNAHSSLRAKTSTDSNQDAMYLSGTSVSSPVVAGAAALMLQANPNLTPNMVKAALQYTAQPLKNFNMFEQGAGELNIVGAIQIAKLMRRDMQSKFVTDLAYTVDSNGWGPAEKDRSNGESAAGDGNTITLDGVTYAKGFGVHAGSQIRVPLGANYQFFMADVGVDDEDYQTAGTVTFQVWVDGVKKYDSGLVRGDMQAKSVKVDVAGKNELKLIVTDSGDGSANDHADWAAARLTPKVNPIDSLLTAALPTASTNIGVGANFSWAQGIIFNRTYGTGSTLITKSQKVFGEGWLLGDGVTESSTTASVNTTLMSTAGITVGTQVKTSSGIVMGDGTVFTNVSNLLGDGIVMGDGITMGDGIVMGDGITMGDGIVMGDTRAMSFDGDNTACMKP